MPVYSFEIFDTLLARNVATVTGVFALLRGKLRDGGVSGLPECIVDEFIHIRREAEELALESSGSTDPTLTTIYEAMGRRYPELAPEQLVALRELEEAIELEQCGPVPEKIEKLLALKSAGERVILLGNTYLGEPLLRQMLGDIDPRLADLRIYRLPARPRGEFGAGICASEKISPSALVHTGKSGEPAFEALRRSGARVVDFSHSSLQPLEKAYFREPGNLFLQLFAGASRRSRLLGHGEKPSFHLGSGFTGPLFYGFVHELLQQAEDEGLRRVYFLARDGYLLKQIADEIIAALGLKVETDYLYVSRRSTYLASMIRLTENGLGWVFQEMDNRITLDLVARRLQLTRERLLGFLAADDRRLFAGQAPDARLDAQQIRVLKRRMIETQALRKSIETIAAEEREKALGYFTQCGLLDGGRIGCVDIGWKGTLQDAVFKILKTRRPDVELTAYYFAVTHFSEHTFARNRKIPFHMFPSTKAGIGPVFELLLQCAHGTTIGYEEAESGDFSPVLKAPVQDQTEWSIDSYSRGIRTFARLFSEALRQNPKVETYYQAVAPILIEKLKDADPSIAIPLGKLSYSGDQEESHLRPIAPPFDLFTAIRYVFGGSEIRRCLTQWFEGTYAGSTLGGRIILNIDPRRNLSGLAARVLRRDERSRLSREIRIPLKWIGLGDSDKGK